MNYTRFINSKDLRESLCMQIGYSFHRAGGGFSGMAVPQRYPQRKNCRLAGNYRNHAGLFPDAAERRTAWKLPRFFAASYCISGNIVKRISQWKERCLSV